MQYNHSKMSYQTTTTTTTTSLSKSCENHNYILDVTGEETSVPYFFKSCLPAGDLCLCLQLLTQFGQRSHCAHWLHAWSFTLTTSQHEGEPVAPTRMILTEKKKKFIGQLKVGLVVVQVPSRMSYLFSKSFKIWKEWLEVLNTCLRSKGLWSSKF